MSTIFSELLKHVNPATFLSGLIAGIALSIAIYTIGAFISRHWKSTLIVCAVVATGALVMLAR